MHPSDVPSFPSHRAHPPHTHAEAEQEARGSLWGSLSTRATPPPAGKRGSACPEGTGNLGDTGEPPSHPGEGCAGKEPLSRAHCVNPALLELFSWISLEMELGSHPAAAASWGAPRGWSSWKHIPLAPICLQSQGRQKGGIRFAPMLPLLSFAALFWPQCLMPSTCQSRGPGLVPSSVHRALLVPFWGCPGPRSTGQGQGTLTWERPSLGTVPAQVAALCSSHPAAHRGWHCDRNSIQLKVPAGRNW